MKEKRLKRNGYYKESKKEQLVQVGFMERLLNKSRIK